MTATAITTTIEAAASAACLLPTQNNVAEKCKIIYDKHNLFIFINKLLLQLEALSNLDNFTVITIIP